ncbi:MAG: YfhO family protein [Eubacteriales bacterium]|nr:YfhO family protein [Eubacteriales bacterium]
MKDNQRSDNRRWRPGKEQQTRILLLFALCLASALVFREYLFGEKTLVFNDIGSDTYQLYTMQFASIINHLREGSFSIWDFTNGFGINQFNLNLFDPSEMLVFAMGYVLGSGRVLFYLVLVQILKILAAGWIFYHYLSCFSLSRPAKFAAAFAYGLNGYLLVWGQHYQFGMVTVYFPLMLLACEKYLQGKKSGKLFPVTVFLCGIYSVYFSFMALSGVGVYLLIRSLMLEDVSGKERVKKFFAGCLQILLGLAMAMVIFLPMAECILGVSGRVGGSDGGILQRMMDSIRKFPYAKYFQSLLLRMYSSTLQTTGDLADSWFENLYNYYEDPVVFAGTLSVFLNLQLLCVFWKKKVSVRRKIGVYAGAFLIIFSLVLPVVGTVMNSFTYYTGRFTFLLTPFLLLGMAWSLDDLGKEGRIQIPALVVGTAGLLAASIIGYGQSVFASYRLNALVIGVTGCLMAAVLILLSFRKKEKSRRAVWAVLMALMMVNLVSEADTNYEERRTLNRQDTPAETYGALAEEADKMRDSEDAETAALGKLAYPQQYFRDLYASPVTPMLADLRASDKELYRVEKDYILNTTTTSMDGLAQNYRGLTSYNSVQNKNIIDFIDVVIPEVHYPDKNHFLFAKVMDDNELASFLGVRYLMSYRSDLDDYGYDLIGTYEPMYLYRNEKQTDFAHFYTRTISEESFRKLCKEETRLELLGNVIALEDGEEISSMEEVIGENSGDDQVEESVAEEINSGESKSKKTEAEQESRVVMGEPERDSHLSGSIKAASDGYVLFMIPFEKGWKLQIDGEDTELQKGDLGFLACSVTEGNHEFTLTFEAPGLRKGMAVSAVFWMIYLLLYFPGVIPLYLRKVRMK